MKNKFKDYFKKEKVFLPVIHVRYYTETLYNVEVCQEAGADGAWLISHGDISYHELMEIQAKVISDFNGFNIGVNYLDLDTHLAIRLASGIGMGLWTDNAGINDTETLNERPNFDGLYFGGVAFKYQRPVKELVRVSQEAAKYIDVITTSGEGTGIAASLDKIKTMREAVGDHPIALASGIDINNVENYLPHVNAFLVASSLSLNGNFYKIDKIKARDLAEVINNANKVK